MANVGPSRNRPKNHYGYVPTPEEIEARAAEVRAGWTEQRWAKQFGAPKPVELLEAAPPRGRKRSGEIDRKPHFTEVGSCW